MKAYDEVYSRYKSSFLSVCGQMVAYRGQMSEFTGFLPFLLVLHICWYTNFFQQMYMTNVMPVLYLELVWNCRKDHDFVFFTTQSLATVPMDRGVFVSRKVIFPRKEMHLLCIKIYEPRNPVRITSVRNGHRITSTHNSGYDGFSR